MLFLRISRKHTTTSKEGFFCRYTALIGFLYVVYALSGMDAAAHMAEETWHAGRLAARSIYLSFLINSALGFALLLAFLFSLQVRLQI